MRYVLSTLFFIFCSSTFSAGLERLENFVTKVKTGRAFFTQVVISPRRDGQAQRLKNSSGVFLFSRPKKFKFEYQKPFVQSIVADGGTLWMFDLELNQVTSSNQSKILQNSPIGLIAGASDLAKLKTYFEFSEAPPKDGIEWVFAKPLITDGQIQTLMVGFKSTSKNLAELAVLDLMDNFGQRSILTFQEFQVNPVLPSDTFVFQPPPGADVIRQ